jgi:hypothetical protein
VKDDPANSKGCNANKPRFFLTGICFVWGVVFFAFTIIYAMQIFQLSDVMDAKVKMFAVISNAIFITLLNNLFRWNLSSPICLGNLRIELIGRTVLGTLGVGIFVSWLILGAVSKSSKAEADAVSELALNIMFMAMSAAVAFGSLVGWNCLPRVVVVVANVFSGGLDQAVFRPLARCALRHEAKRKKNKK